MLAVLSAALGALLLAQGSDCAIVSEMREDAVLMRPACPAGRERTQQAIAETLAKAGSAKVVLSFGRIVRYPWLSDLLVRQASGSADWKPGIGKDNAYVAAALRAMPEFASLFGAWRITRVSVEKVLVAPKTRLPYDAILWVTLER